MKMFQRHWDIFVLGHRGREAAKHKKGADLGAFFMTAGRGGVGRQRKVPRHENIPIWGWFHVGLQEKGREGP